MERINILSKHFFQADGQSQLNAAPTSGNGAKVFPPGKKHFVTNPNERLARYEGDGGATKAVTIPQKFRERVQAVGDKNALAQKRGARDGPWTTWTWKEYHVEIMKVARALMSLGCAPHEALNVLGFNSPEWAFVAFGGIFAGMTPAGIYITNAPDAVEYIMNHSKTRLMFVDSNPQMQKVLEVRSRCPTLITTIHWGADCPKDVDGVMSWEGFVALAAKTTEAALESRIAALYPDNACYLSYTSGTTGQPKAVMYSHDNVIWGMTNILKYAVHSAGYTMDEREVSYMPLSHIAGNVQILGAITYPATGNTTVHFAFPDAMQGSLPDTLKEVRPTYFLGVPRVWEKFALGVRGALAAKPELKQAPKAVLGLLGLDQAKFAMTGAAPIAQDIMELYDSLGLPIYEIYGMTENTAYSHFNYLGKRRIGSVGPTLTDEGAGSKLAEGTNEICTWSRAVMMGYMYMPEKTADTFDDEGFLRTGDVGTEVDGFTLITGRIKEMLITAGGENVAPVLLEAAIKERLPALSNVVMIGDRQKYLIALMTLKLEPNTTGGFTNKLAAEALAVDPACKTFEEAQKSDVWKRYVDSGIEAANKVAISRAQHTRKFHVLPGDFSPLGDLPELTPTMKLRREIILNKYKDAIKMVYGEDFATF